MSRNGRRTATRKSDTELSTPDVSMHALAEVVRTEAHEAIAPVKTKLSSTQATLEKMFRCGRQGRRTKYPDRNLTKVHGENELRTASSTPSGNAMMEN